MADLLTPEQISVISSAINDPETSEEATQALRDWRSAQGLTNAGTTDAFLSKSFPGILTETMEFPSQAEVDANRESAVTDAQKLARLGIEPVEAPSFAESIKILGTADQAASIVSNLVGSSLGGIIGTGVAVGTQDADKGVNALETVREFLAFAPQTPAGRYETEGLAKKIGPVAEIAEKVNSGAGAWAFDKWGPEAATVAYMLPQVAEMFVPYGAIKRGISSKTGLLGDARVDTGAGTLVPSSSPTSVVNRTQVENVQRTALNHPTIRYHEELADVKLNTAGEVVPDGNAINMVDNGLQPKGASVISKSSPSTRAGMRQMLERYRSNLGNLVDVQRSHVLDVFGKSVVNRMKFLQERREGLGSQLNDFVRKPEFETVEIPMSDTIGGFHASLMDELGVNLTPKQGGGVDLDFSGTALDMQTMAGTRRLLNDFNSLVASKTDNGMVSGLAAHRLKRDIDNLIDAAKVSEGGLTGQSQRVLLEFRQSLNDSLGAASPGYKAINEELSTVIDTMSPFNAYLPKGKKWDSEGVVENVINSFDGSTVSANQVESLLGLERSLSNMPTSKFSDEPLSYLIFENQLDGFYTPLRSARTQLQSNAGNLAARQAADFAASAATSNVFGMAHAAPKFLFTAARGTRGQQIRRLIRDEKAGTAAIERALSAGQ